MTIFNEAVRLFFAVSALVLVGLLSAPMGGISIKDTEIATKAASLEAKAPAHKSKHPVKITDRKGQRKIILKKG
jgi:hypothetical protein